MTPKSTDIAFIQSLKNALKEAGVLILPDKYSTFTQEELDEKIKNSDYDDRLTKLKDFNPEELKKNIKKSLRSIYDKYQSFKLLSEKLNDQFEKNIENPLVELILSRLSVWQKGNIAVSINDRISWIVTELGNRVDKLLSDEEYEYLGKIDLDDEEKQEKLTSIFDQIKLELEKFEKIHKVKILFASETGSRAWEYKSPNSDYDIRFIYIRDPNWYAQYTRDKKPRDTLEIEDYYIDNYDNPFDAVGWDLEKCCLSLALDKETKFNKFFQLRSNAPLLERINSPMIYRNTDGFLERFKKLYKVYQELALPSVLYHYNRMAENHFKWCREEKVNLKKLFYAIRSTMAGNWIRKKQTLPPMSLLDMLPKALESDEKESKIRSEIEALIALKGEIDEGYHHPKKALKTVLDFTENCLKLNKNFEQQLKQAMSPLLLEKELSEAKNEFYNFFQDILKKHHARYHFLSDENLFLERKHYVYQLKLRGFNAHALAYEFVAYLAEAIDKNKGEAYLVGGAVRDAVLCKISKDFDIEVHKLDYDKVLDIVKQCADEFANGIDVSEIALKPIKENNEVKEDIIVSNKKSKPSNNSSINTNNKRQKLRVNEEREAKIKEKVSIREAGKKFKVIKAIIKGVEVDISLPTDSSKEEAEMKPMLGIEKASKRRDFSLNGLAVNLKSRKILDFHKGIEDLKQKQLRVIDKNLFFDDPVRIMRAVQFVARFQLNLEINSEDIIRKGISALKNVKVERIQDEWRKLLLKGVKPSWGLMACKELKILEEHYPMFAELSKNNNPWQTTLEYIDRAAVIIRRRGQVSLEKNDQFLLMIAVLCAHINPTNCTKFMKAIGLKTAGINGQKVAAYIKYGHRPLKLYRQLNFHEAQQDDKIEKDIKQLASEITPLTMPELLLFSEVINSEPMSYCSPIIPVLLKLAEKYGVDTKPPEAGLPATYMSEVLGLRLFVKQKKEKVAKPLRKNFKNDSEFFKAKQDWNEKNKKKKPSAAEKAYPILFGQFAELARTLDLRLGGIDQIKIVLEKEKNKPSIDDTKIINYLKELNISPLVLKDKDKELSFSTGNVVRFILVLKGMRERLE